VPSDDDVTISDNPDAHRYEVRVGGELAGFAEYRLVPGRVVFTHTEIDDAFEGRGLGSKLAGGALDAVRARDLTVTPQCPFIKSFIERHADYADLVDAGSASTG
jgi:predicted GNAT family acetyltransferase